MRTIYADFLLLFKIINITYSFFCDILVSQVQCRMNMIVCNRNLTFKHIINLFHIKYVQLQLQKYYEISQKESVIFFFINFKIFIFFILLFIKIRVHTPVRLYTAFYMITVCNITVTYRLTALSKRRINTLGVTVFSKESNFTGYTYKHISLINLYTGMTLCL